MRRILAIAATLLSMSAATARDEGMPLNSTVFVKSGKTFFNTELRLPDFANHCLNADRGATAWSEYKGVITFDCTLERAKDGKSETLTYSFWERSKNQLVLDGVASSLTGSYPIPGAVIDISKFKYSRLALLDVYAKDIYGRSIKSDRVFNEFETDCRKRYGKSDSEVSSVNVTFKCTYTPDFIEHPATKPAVVTFTYVFTDQGDKLLIEGVSTSRGQKLQAAQIEMILSNLTPSR